ncbi:MAG TPA: hypothetical protein VFT19_11170 [Solirubrobacterales bacterium]|nr:hypothetical protein [Solirubrobacterales bacterium]
MKTSLGAFARTEIEAAAESDLAEGVERALAHYARRVGEGDPPPRVPCFLGLGDVPEPAQIAAHAVMVYLADRDRPGSQVLSAARRS